jgi:hypothetical protein
MSKTAEQVQALQTELQAWLEHRGLAGCAAWQTPEAFYGTKLGEYAVRPYLVLVSENISDIVSDWDLPPASPPPRPGASRLKEEFLAIVQKHGFEHDFEEGPVVCLMCAEERQAEYDRGCARSREANEKIQQMIAAGWQRYSDHWLVHPTDKDRSMMYDPYKEEWLMSPKEAALVAAAIQAQQESDSTRSR